VSEQTFLFADLSGFTALTEHHGDEEAAQLALEFSEACRELLGRHGATEVKTIGDAMLIRCSDADEAIMLGISIVADIGDRHGFPAIRVGMHTGPAVERDGDWFGATVNLAARVSGEASGGQVLLTEQTRHFAGKLRDVRLVPRGRRELRNVREPVILYEALREAARQADDLPIDPVCRMAVDPEHAAGTLLHRGAVFHFCSLECARAFASEPERYASSRRLPDT